MFVPVALRPSPEGLRGRAFALAMVVLTFLFFGPSQVHAGAMSPADTLFLQRAAEANIAEVKISQVAQTRATESVVKAYADRMVEDHLASNRELDVLARKKNVALTGEPDAAHLMKIGSLQKLKAGEFDRAYVQLMIDEHAGVERLFEQTARDAVDADVRKFAQNALEMWREHAALAQALPR